MPQDLLASSDGAKGNDLLAGKDLLADKAALEAKPDAPKKDDSFVGGMERGFMERAVGADIMLNQIGVGGTVPQFVNGKIVFGLPPNEELAKVQEQLEAEGKGTGIKGEVAEQVGDPANYVPLGKMSMLAKGGVQGALSAFTSPTTNSKQTLTDRAENTGMGAALGGVTGKLLDKLGGTMGLGGKPTGEMTNASPLFKAVNQLGIKLTGKETPEEIYSKIQTGLKDKIGELAEKVSPGSSTAKVWPVGVNLATSQVYQKVREEGGKLYTVAKDLGSKLTAPVEGIEGDVKALIDDMEKDQLSQGLNPKFGTALRKLRDLHTNLTESVESAAKDPWNKILDLMKHGEAAQAPKEVNGAQLIDLDQTLNELHGRSGQGGAGGRAFSKLQGKVNDSIKQMSPEFGAAYQKAKDYWKANVIHRFEENKELHKFWKPEDFDAFRDMQKGIPLHPNLKTRVVDQLDKITDWNSLEVLKGQLPPQMYDTVRAAKFIDLMDKAGLDAKAMTDDKTYALMLKSVGNKPEDIQALDAIKTFAEQMQKRGIGSKVSSEDLAESDKLMDRSVRTVMGFATRHKLYGLSHLWDMVKPVEKKDIKAKLLGLSEDVVKGAPKQILEPNTAIKTVVKPLTTGEGESVGDTRE